MRRKRKKQKRQIKIFIGLTICFLLIMTVGYAAFQTTLTLNAKGNIKDKSRIIQSSGPVQVTKIFILIIIQEKTL